MKIDQTLDRHISKLMLEENKKERENHVSSGKLSASMLGQPLQWQILKSIGVPPKEIDEYTLRVFKRGKDIEDWIVKLMPGLVDTQVAVTYRNVVGFIDAWVDTEGYEFKEGIIPFEVKSVKNSKFKRIIEQGSPDRSHLLQGALYALAKGCKSFEIVYIAADDLRIQSFVMNAFDFKFEIDKIIDVYDNQLKLRYVPEFVAVEPWMSSVQYNNYPEWMCKSPEEIRAKLEYEYPESYKRLLNYKQSC